MAHFEKLRLEIGYVENKDNKYCVSLHVNSWIAFVLQQNLCLQV